MRKELVQKFWDDMFIPTQNEDSSVNFANPTDVATSLVKARNWASTIAQELISEYEKSHDANKELKKITNEINLLEADVLASADKIPTVAMKNALTQRGFVLRQATESQRKHLLELLALAESWEEILSRVDTSIGQLETMRKALERSTDWLVQYINWHKFELRELSQ
jgi:hypothetical protein